MNAKPTNAAPTTAVLTTAVPMTPSPTNAGWTKAGLTNAGRTSAATSAGRRRPAFGRRLLGDPTRRSRVTAAAPLARTHLVRSRPAADRRRDRRRRVRRRRSDGRSPPWPRLALQHRSCEGGVLVGGSASQLGQARRLDPEHGRIHLELAAPVVAVSGRDRFEHGRSRDRGELVEPSPPKTTMACVVPPASSTASIRSAMAASPIPITGGWHRRGC